VLEHKRLERSREKLDKVTLLLAPFEKKDIIGLDLESRANKRKYNLKVDK
jgi:trafficking protein particle complex subunit 9